MTYAVCPVVECMYSQSCRRHQLWSMNPDYVDVVVLEDPRKDNGYCYIYDPEEKEKDDAV